MSNPQEKQSILIFTILKKCTYPESWTHPMNTPQDTIEDVSTEEPEKLMFRLQSKRFRVHF